MIDDEKEALIIEIATKARIIKGLQSRIKSLEDRDAWLQCLEAAGVDNWQGIDEAFDMRNEAK